MARKKKQTDLPEENVDNTDDTFGLPEVEYEPLKRDDPAPIDGPEVVVINEVQQGNPEPPRDEPFQYQDPEPISDEPQSEKTFDDHRPSFEDENPYQPTYSYQRETPEVWPKVVGFILVLLLAGGAVWYFAFYRPQQLAQEEKERKEILAIQEEARRKEAERQAALRKAEEDQKVVTQIVAPPVFGGIETLSGRTGRYYVVIASSIDGDLIMDYAKKLSVKGVGTKIIPPFGKSKFHRLAVAEGDTYETTQISADGLKGGDYGDKVWVVKY